MSTADSVLPDADVPVDNTSTGDVEAKALPKESRDSGHESSASGTPDAERAMTPESKDGVVDVSTIPEAVYTLKIEIPNGDRFEVNVNNTEMLQEIHQVLIEREGTCHRTCYALQLDGRPLDHFSEIRAVPGLKDGSVLSVVEEPYTLREARIHIRHVRDLAKNPDQGEAASAVDGTSLSYLPVVGLNEKKPTKEEKEKGTPLMDGLPPEWVLPGSKERPLSSIIPSPSPSKQTGAIRNMGLSPYNPPIPSRRIKGDVLYLYVDTLEKKRVHITCGTAGFFVNGTDDTGFKPQSGSGNKTTVYHSLVDLLNNASPLFKKTFANLIKKRVERPLLDRLPTPYPQFSWLAPVVEAVEDALRAEDATQPSRVGIEDHLPGQIRDWNEELQTTNELPRVSLNERVVRDRSVFKIHSDFVGAAVRGAQAVVEGNVMAINPADEPKTHMYIWNNIFFSLGFDVKDHYKELGGDAAAFAATSADLQGVRAYASVAEDSSLATLGMAVVDYKGFRVTAQSIIPGILEREQEQSVVYGSIDFGKSVVSHEKYHELLEKYAKDLKILPHEVWNGKEGEEKKFVKLLTSFETKGIIGNDSRYYVLDLLRTMPPDVHFLADCQVSDSAKEAGFPRPFPHKLVAFRKELVDAFVEFRYVMFVRIATYHLQSKTKEKEEKGRESENTAEKDAEPKTIDSETQGIDQEALQKAAEAVHSLKPDGFEIRFNPDCFSTTVQHAEGENLESQRRLVVDLGEFLLTQQLPALLVDLVECAVSPIDGEGLVDQMHGRGINVRYLGQLVKKAPKECHWLRAILGCELVSRAAKHVLRTLLQSVRPEKTAAAAAHLLSCLMAPVGGIESVQSSEGGKKKSGKKGGRGRGANAAEWEQSSQKSVWKAICDEAASYYGFPLELSGVDALAEEFGTQKVSLLRRVCRIVGFQLLAKDYGVSNGTAPVTGKAIFVEDDIQNVFPVTKHRNPVAADAKRLYLRGQQEMSGGRLREAYEYTAEAVNLMTSVYGAMHGDLAQALRSLARLSYILGDPSDALSQQHRAAIMAERCYGIDAPDTILEYVNLAHIAFANLLVPAALRLLYRARYLMLIVVGELHPFMAVIDANIGVVLYAVQEFDLAIRFLQSSEKISTECGEPKRLKSALLNHVLARAHSCRGDFRTALTAEKETFTIYSSLLGNSHEKTKESNECLKQLTHQAVQFQRRLQDSNKGAANNLAQLLPLNQPSLASIIEVLNVINGIVIFSFRDSSSPEESTAAVPIASAPVPALEEETLD